MSQATTPSGFKIADTERLHRIHNRAAAEIARIAGNNDAECLRLLRVLGTMLCETGNVCFGADPDEEGARLADGFWEKRQRMIRRAKGLDDA